MTTPTNQPTRRRTRGVTLVEIAIVLVIIGLLLGGVLKGQELINNAKVRSMADRQNSLKVAWFSFIDRYGGIPGDYVRARANVPGAQADGDGDGIIPDGGSVGSGSPGANAEAVNVMQHLTGAGYLRCPQCLGAPAGIAVVSAKNSLVNQYGGVMSIFHNPGGYAAIGLQHGSLRRRLMTHTGQGIPSTILAELDRKIDDGIANTGDMVFAQWSATAGQEPHPNYCMSKVANPSLPADSIGGRIENTVPQAYRGALAQPAVEQNCGAGVTI